MTAEAVTSAPVGEAGFRLLADQLPDLIILAFDRELVMWAATGGGLRGNGWTPENFVGLRLPEIAGSTRAEPIEACARAALGGQCSELEMPGYEDPTSDELAISEEMTRILGLEPGSRLAMGEGEGVVDEDGRVFRVAQQALANVVHPTERWGA